MKSTIKSNGSSRGLISKNWTAQSDDHRGNMKQRTLMRIPLPGGQSSMLQASPQICLRSSVCLLLQGPCEQVTPLGWATPMRLEVALK